MLFVTFPFASLGDDFTVTGFTGSSRTISGTLSSVQQQGVTFQIVNDVEPGEVEKFVFELSATKVVAGTGTEYEVLIERDSFSVEILDNDSR